MNQNKSPCQIPLVMKYHIYPNFELHKHAKNVMIMHAKLHSEYY
jgi:hypothetical protein